MEKLIYLPPRFDLLYLILDRVDEEADKRLAKHLVSLYMEDELATAGIDVIVSMQQLSAKILMLTLEMFGSPSRSLQNT